MSDTALRLADVACMRAGRLLLRGVSLSLEPGQGALLRGPNGTGKSSLLRVVAGLLPAFSGKVERRGALALCDEHAALDADLTLGAALSFWAGIDGAGPDAVAAALDAFGLAHLRDIPVRMLSTGQRKRAALARTYASGAAIWLLDEPANGLDQQALALLGQAIADHLGRGGIVLAASHQPLPFAPVHDIDLAAHVPAEEESA